MVSVSCLNMLAPLALVLLASPFATPAFAQDGDASADEVTEDEPADQASVKIELKQPSGKILKYDGALLDWGADGNVTFKQDDHVHDVSLRIDRSDDKGAAISLTVGYTKDGKPIIEPQTVDSEIKKREVIRIEGGVAIAITVTSKNAKAAPPPPAEEPKEEEPPAEEPKPKKKRLEGGGGDDPLDGLK